MDETRPQVTVTRPGEAPPPVDVLVAGDERPPWPPFRVPRWLVLTVVGVVAFTAASVGLVAYAGRGGGEPGPVGALSLASVQLEVVDSRVTVQGLLVDPLSPFVAVDARTTGAGLVAETDGDPQVDGSIFLGEATQSGAQFDVFAPTCTEPTGPLVLHVTLLRSESSVGLARLPVPQEQVRDAVTRACGTFATEPPVTVMLTVSSRDAADPPTRGDAQLNFFFRTARRLDRVESVGIDWPGVDLRSLPQTQDPGAGIEGFGNATDLLFDCSVAFGAPRHRYRVPGGPIEYAPVSEETPGEFGLDKVAELRSQACG